VPRVLRTLEADSCLFTWNNFYQNMDIYYVAHLVNWIFAALICREKYILLVWSVYDELIEISAKHLMPHFAECWWDQII